MNETFEISAQKYKEKNFPDQKTYLLFEVLHSTLNQNKLKKCSNKISSRSVAIYLTVIQELRIFSVGSTRMQYVIVRNAGKTYWFA